ncbi:6557_t:CDS:2, partial [Acaulospora morrowiae]
MQREATVRMHKIESFWSPVIASTTNINVTNLENNHSMGTEIVRDYNIMSPGNLVNIIISLVNEVESSKITKVEK